MINHVNKNIDIKALEDRLAEEIEDRLEFSCYAVNKCSCDSKCNVNYCSCNATYCGGNSSTPVCSANRAC